MQGKIESCPALLERVTGLEPVTSCLGSKRSTTELHPLIVLLYENYVNREDFVGRHSCRFQVAE